MSNVLLLRFVDNQSHFSLELQALIPLAKFELKNIFI